MAIDLHDVLIARDRPISVNARHRTVRAVHGVFSSQPFEDIADRVVHESLGIGRIQMIQGEGEGASTRGGARAWTASDHDVLPFNAVIPVWPRSDHPSA